MEAGAFSDDLLPGAGGEALLIGRTRLRKAGAPSGMPLPVARLPQGWVRLDGVACTVSEILELPDLVDRLRSGPFPTLTPAELEAAELLSPADLQPAMACGLTFDPDAIARASGKAAPHVRSALEAIGAASLSDIVPGSHEAAKAREILVPAGLWDAALEVSHGPEGEMFVKAGPMMSVGASGPIAIDTRFGATNSEPEAVLAITSRGKPVGMTLGNDMNLRGLWERSPLLLTKAKNYHASCALGPFIRLFDEGFGLDDFRQVTIEFTVERDGRRIVDERFALKDMTREPRDLVAQCIGSHRAFPDGFMLFLGTPFDPDQHHSEGADSGFSHREGDVVTIRSDHIGRLQNQALSVEAIAREEFGIAALFRMLCAARPPAAP